jgi:acetate kinase
MMILVINAGSSSVKCSLFKLTAPPFHFATEPLWKATVNTLPLKARVEFQNSGEPIPIDLSTQDSRQALLVRVLETIWSGERRVIESPSAIDLVGHRVVHGGAEFDRAVRVTSAVKTSIQRLEEYAPLHNKEDLAQINFIEQLLPDTTQFAVFDTAFHRSLPLEASVYPGPYEWLAQGIRRYGFHGISHQYCVRRAAHLLQRQVESLRAITCHLGNGCSLAAIRQGVSIDTTMGFTPLDGLMMGTRSGSIDPGILMHLMRHRGAHADGLDLVLNQESGLKGVYGESGDMRAVLAARALGNPRARLAFDVYVHRLRAGIGAMLASLQGAEALVFAGGVGENSTEVRAAACNSFSFVGLKLDLERNLAPQGDQEISAADSAVRVFVVRTQEEWEIARQGWELAMGVA